MGPLPPLRTTPHRQIRIQQPPPSRLSRQHSCPATENGRPNPSRTLPQRRDLVLLLLHPDLARGPAPLSRELVPAGAVADRRSSELAAGGLGVPGYGRQGQGLFG